MYIFHRIGNHLLALYIQQTRFGLSRGNTPACIYPGKTLKRFVANVNVSDGKSAVMRRMDTDGGGASELR